MLQPPKIGRANYFDQKVSFPGNGVPHNNLGSVYFDQQLLNDALALFRVALPLALPFKSGVRSNIAVYTCIRTYMHTLRYIGPAV